MTIKTVAIAAGALLAGFAFGPTPARAQGPMYDRVDVNLPYTVTLGDTTLQPGDYTIKELPSQNKERVLLIYSNGGLKHEATVMTIPAYDNRTPDDTKVMLHHYGPDYYFDKIWIAGKNYGYEFPVPQNIKERQREREGPVSVAATYQPAPAETTTAAATPAPAAETTTAAVTPAPAENTPPAASTPPVPPAASTPPQPPANEQVAQNTPPPEQASPVQTSPDNSANRDASDTNNNQPKNEKLPSTSADWFTLLLAGGTLSSIGFALRSKL